MKSIILYHSKTGCTEKCANYVNERNETELHKIVQFKGSLKDYDTVVIMGPVYMGKFEGVAKGFIEKFKHELLTKKLIIVIIGMNTEGFDAMVKHSIPEEIINHAEIIHGGGAYYLEKMSKLSHHNHNH